MTEQRRKLMAMLGTAVANLDKLETSVPAAQDLGRRHVTYGVPLQSYDAVGAAIALGPRPGPRTP
jgi:hemoglobin-like flavoprotein